MLTKNYMLAKLTKTGILEAIARAIDLTDTQRKTAEERYNAVGRYLASSDNPRLTNADIYPQGSIALGTTVKPLEKDEYDVDLVSNLPLASGSTPAEIKKIVGDRLRQNGNYSNILEEKKRCWRLNYRGEFHMDITPSIPNPNGGEYVPDKELQEFVKSNPRDYIQLFNARAALKPKMQFSEGEYASLHAQIENLPAEKMTKGVLRRSIQLCKRNRDIFFREREDKEFSPISIILTTLAAQSYVACVQKNVYETELDLFYDVVSLMPKLIEVSDSGTYSVWNETTEGENFAEKWNQDTRYFYAFQKWHENMLHNLTLLKDKLAGIDEIGKHLSLSFGQNPVSKIIETYTDQFNRARKAVPSGTSPRPNTFYGE